MQFQSKSTCDIVFPKINMNITYLYKSATVLSNFFKIISFPLYYPA